MDKNTRTFRVKKIYEDNVKWDNHEICPGVANLLIGLIKEGYIVTNCQGYIASGHVPSNTLFGGFNFEELFYYIFLPYKFI